MELTAQDRLLKTASSSDCGQAHHAPSGRICSQAEGKVDSRASMMTILISSTLALIMRFAESLSMMLEDGSTPNTGSITESQYHHLISHLLSFNQKMG